MNNIETMKLALEAITKVPTLTHGVLVKLSDVEKAIEQAQQAEPVAWRVSWPKIGGGYAWVMNDAPLMQEHGFVNEPLYTSPPLRQTLSFEQVEDCFPEGYGTEDNGILVSAQWLHDFARAIEAAHGIKVEA